MDNGTFSWLLTDGGPLGILAGVIIAMMRGLLVPKVYYDRAVEQADRFEKLALESLKTTHQAVEAARRDAREGERE